MANLTKWIEGLDTRLRKVAFLWKDEKNPIQSKHGLKAVTVFKPIDLSIQNGVVELRFFVFLSNLDVSSLNTMLPDVNSVLTGMLVLGWDDGPFIEVCPFITRYRIWLGWMGGPFFWIGPVGNYWFGLYIGPKVQE